VIPAESEEKLITQHYAHTPELSIIELYNPK